MPWRMLGVAATFTFLQGIIRTHLLTVARPPPAQLEEKKKKTKPVEEKGVADKLRSQVESG